MRELTDPLSEQPASKWRDSMFTVRANHCRRGSSVALSRIRYIRPARSPLERTAPPWNCRAPVESALTRLPTVAHSLPGMADVTTRCAKSRHAASTSTLTRRVACTPVVSRLSSRGCMEARRLPADRAAAASSAWPTVTPGPSVGVCRPVVGSNSRVGSEGGRPSERRHQPSP